jgi:hypothetical protein
LRVAADEPADGLDVRAHVDDAVVWANDFIASLTTE